MHWRRQTGRAQKLRSPVLFARDLRANAGISIQNTSVDLSRIGAPTQLKYTALQMTEHNALCMGLTQYGHRRDPCQPHGAQPLDTLLIQILQHRLKRVGIHTMLQCQTDCIHGGGVCHAKRLEGNQVNVCSQNAYPPRRGRCWVRGQPKQFATVKYWQPPRLLYGSGHPNHPLRQRLNARALVVYPWHGHIPLQALTCKRIR